MQSDAVTDADVEGKYAGADAGAVGKRAVTDADAVGNCAFKLPCI